ncbi:MAG: hypothetical protein MJD61_18975 [Proteobacteria bacterium]|nr:hypothetical protein [Pseudomonadota bacterium]
MAVADVAQGHEPLRVADDAEHGTEKRPDSSGRAKTVAMIKRVVWKPGIPALGTGVVLYLIGRGKGHSEPRRGLQAGVGVTPRGAAAAMTLSF